ncbi:MAG: twin-arginine translocase subunit TatC [Deltaproteobacteria bacterium]|nr:twin-arginine translocase subunit TatC [Deltaproteobacteria bacterium]
MTEQASASEAPLMEHLVELRKALVRVLLVAFVGFAICLYYSEDIYLMLAAPLMSILPEKSHFIATHPIEAWVTYLKTAFFCGLFFSSPFMFFSIWKFIAPGLKKSEKKWGVAFVASTSLCFVAGALFGYFEVFPYVFSFFLSIINPDNIVFLPQMDSYLSFVFKLILAFGLTFEIPVLMTLLSLSGIVTFKAMFSFQRYMIVSAFIVSAILTPPDWVTQILMALPIIALYQLGLLLAWIVGKKQSA